jgi:hypothetical protein
MSVAKLQPYNAPSIVPPTDAKLPEVGSGAAVITLRHTPVEHERTKDAAHYRRMSVNEFVRRAVREATGMALDSRDEQSQRVDAK